MEDASQTWTPDPHDISREPSCLSTLKCTQSDQGEFPRSAKWCSDGSTVIAQMESGTFQRYDVSFQEPIMQVREERPAKTFPQPAPVLDFLWYPTASSLDAASFCFVASVRECPVKLLDASDGRLRASYKIVDHRERQIAPHSLAFNLTAQKLYCGFEDAIEMFDLSRPGEGTRIPTTPSKKSKDGLKGIISALAFSSSYTAEESFYAVGSFTPTAQNIAMFSDAQSEPLMYVGGGPRAGVTQLRFNPTKPHILYAGYRGHSSGMIYSWDIRSNVDTPLEIFYKSPADKGPTRSNQRMYFDIDITGRLLSTGDQARVSNGSVSVFELDDYDASIALSAEVEPSDDNLYPKTISPALQFKAHEDAVGSIAFHPFRPILLSASGSRHFLDDDDGSGSDTSSSGEGELSGPAKHSRRSRPVTLDPTMKIWDLRKDAT
ncbi:hypothetical protein BDN70DRAFT_935760 [Pholiota conissans]|uniref:Telomerase Cajal body protein 1 n=1 Tax=Pholiota conissans TaxID=109636 RepID=A0A9P5YW19_9AGAR|nr:hypothetical protein BDN70DRAFT_935760 [Pholiota conissans]